ncbi:MAG TPA: Spy/CpxP family protein refolding chaperone [Thermoanaerobaculia bacterium]
MSIQQIRRSILIVAGAVVLAAAGLFAGRLLAGAVPVSGPGGRFGPPRFARIARALDLTDDQKAQVKAILRTHAAEIQAQLKAGTDARRSLHDAILADPIDEGAIRAKAADLSKVEGDGAVLFARVRAEIYPLLRDDQKQKIVDYRAKVRARSDRAARSVEEFLGEGDK